MGRNWKAIIYICAVLAIARPPLYLCAAEITTENTTVKETKEDNTESNKEQVAQGMSEQEIVTLASETATNTAIETISDIYDNGSIGTTYVTYFRDVYANISPLVKYVAFRESQYTYKFIYGDIELNDTEFNCIDCISVTINVGSNYNSNLSYSIDNYNGNIDVGNNLVYSNMGSYPTLGSKEEVYIYVQTIIICTIGLCMFVRGIFEWHKSIR